MKFLHVVLALLWCVSLASAQEATEVPNPTDSPLFAPISFGFPVEDTISAEAFYDWYLIGLQAGDRIGVTMRGSEGLSPLIGILDTGRNLVARSDGDGRDLAPVNGQARLEYIAPESGQYIIVATRSGVNIGLTTGRYVLEVSLLGQNPPLVNTGVEVEFRCAEQLITNAIELRFAQAPQARTTSSGETLYELYRVTVIGLDGFQPMVRLASDIRQERLDCSSSARGIPTTAFRTPQGETLSLEPETEAGAASLARLVLRNLDSEEQFGQITVSVGSLNGRGGRYLLLLEGLRLDHPNRQSRVELRVAPFARGTTPLIVVIGAPTSRLNPVLELLGPDGADLGQCDDAGRAPCPINISLAGVGGLDALWGGTLTADRFDAALNWTPQNLDWHSLLISSRDGQSRGDYALLIAGELPD
ncbi:MAG: hypothetical protein NZ750_14155 [Anaerolineae bacterium]|nr:hypothetical protein [Anaerolineae bacterium]MDW8173745.1 hypothetical protein [Anaerolineae bacterium]